MRKLFIAGALAALALSTLAAAQTTPNAPAAAVRQHLIGEVTAVDAATGRLTVKTDAGSTVEVTPDEQTVFKRIPPGESSLARAETIARSDVRVGDRVLVPNGTAGGTPRQVIIMARAALDQQREREREED